MNTLDDFRDRIRAAARDGTRLRIRGGGSKDFYGTPGDGELLDTTAHTGIVAYEPSELYVTARCGTPLAELERALDEHGQMLAFEPPHFGAGATVGGMVASGLSGPRRMQCGPLRDFVLGVEIIDGRGERLRFGGRVMKNVAGYDVSRLMAGSLGTLALITEVTLKVLPRPAAEISLRYALSREQALERLIEWGGKPLPISASCWHDGVLTIRLSGGAAAIVAAREKLGGEAVADVDAREFWSSLREQTHPFFGPTLWRITLPPAQALPGSAGAPLLEWAGQQCWISDAAEPARIHAAAHEAGGSATLFRGPTELRRTVGAPSPSARVALEDRVRQVFDPRGVFDTGRLPERS